MDDVWIIMYILELTVCISYHIAFYVLNNIAK